MNILKISYLPRVPLYFLLVLLVISAVNVHPADAQITLLSQPRNTAPSPFSDVDCWECAPPGIQVLAENFVMTSFAVVTQIKIWGGYHFRSIPPANDNFTMFFHNDSGGLPGTDAAPAESNVPVSRFDTGVDVWNATYWADEYEYTLTLANPVPLNPGTYWVELYNDTRGTSVDIFFWRRGGLDPDNGINGLAWSETSAPGTNWQPWSPDLAVDITACRSWSCLGLFSP